VQNLSYENEFDLYENEAVGQMHFHMIGFTCRLVLIPRLKATQKWPISYRQFSPIQATQPYTGNPAIYRQPSHIQATQLYTSNPVIYRQPSHIQATLSHEGNPASHNATICRQLGFILANYG